MWFLHQFRKMVILTVFIYLITWSVVLHAKDLQIVFWIDALQKDIFEDIRSSITELENIQRTEIEIRDIVLVFESDMEKDLEVTSAESMNKICDILSTQGISVVIDFTYRPWSEGIELIETQQIPYLRVGRITTPYLRMFAEYLKAKDANEVVLIFQNEQFKEEALYEIVEGYFPFRALIINALDDVNFETRIRNLRPTPSYYGVFASTAHMNTIFDKINRGRLFARSTEWHFLFMDANDKVFKYVQEAEFATKFTLDAGVLCKSLQMQDAYCSSSDFTFQRALILQIFRSLLEVAQLNTDWLVAQKIDCNSTAPPVQTSFNLLEHLRLSNFMNLTESTSGDGSNTGLLLTYNVNASIGLFAALKDNDMKELAVWEDGVLHKINETISPTKRFFRIGTTEAIPWNYYRRDPHTGEIILDSEGKPIWEGYCIDLIETLAVKLNFEFELVAPTKGTFGERDPKTGRWDGLVGDLVSGETDFAVAALKMYAEREEVIDFLAPYFDQTGISIVIRKPVRQTSLFKFMTVLRVEVWLSIIAALVSTAVMIWLLERYSPYSARNDRESYPYPCREFTLRESFWFALTSFTPQGGGEAPKAVSGRILVAAYWLFVVLMLATFTANLAAFLTVERMQTPVQSLEQLARQSRINYTVVADSDTHSYFINMKFAEDTLYRMWKELSLNATVDAHKYRIWDYPIKEQYGHILLAINASQPVSDAAEGFRKVNEHEKADFAFIHDAMEIKYEITQNCNLTEVGEMFAEQPYAIAVQQGSHLTDEFSYAILELQKDRYFEELRGKYWNHSRLKECASSEDQEGITLESLGGVFIATFFGLGLAMVTLAVEVIYYKKKQSEPLEPKHEITKVKPVSETGPQPPIKAWHTAVDGLGLQSTKEATVTPPPSFEAALLKGKKLTRRGVMLGGDEFKPVNKRLGLQSRRKLKLTPSPKSEEYRDESIAAKDTQLSSYLE